MTRISMLMTVAAVIVLSAPANADGLGEFLGRFNPARLFDRRASDERRPETPGMEQLRERLTDRGLDDAEIDARIAKIEAAREQGMLTRRAALDRDLPDPQALREKLAERGLDESEIEERLARIRQVRERRLSMNRDVATENFPDLDALRSRLEERGIDPDRIDERISRMEGALERRGQLHGRRQDQSQLFGVDGDQIRMRMPPVIQEIALDEKPSVDNHKPAMIDARVIPAALGPGADADDIARWQSQVQPASATLEEAPVPRPTFDAGTMRERMQQRGMTAEQIEQRLSRIANRQRGR